MAPVALSPDYVLSHAVPSAAELRWGLARHWIDPSGCVEICLAKMTTGLPLAPEEESIALLLSDELDQVAVILKIDDEAPVDPGAPESDLWKYLAVQSVVDTSPSFDEQLDAFADLWCDFDHDEELAGLVRFLPPPAGGAIGLLAMKDRLVQYLADSVERFGIKDTRPD